MPVGRGEHHRQYCNNCRRESHASHSEWKEEEKIGCIPLLLSSGGSAKNVWRKAMAREGREEEGEGATATAAEEDDTDDVERGVVGPSCAAHALASIDAISPEDADVEIEGDKDDDDDAPAAAAVDGREVLGRRESQVLETSRTTAQPTSTSVAHTVLTSGCSAVTSTVSDVEGMDCGVFLVRDGVFVLAVTGEEEEGVEVDSREASRRGASGGEKEPEGTADACEDGDEAEENRERRPLVSSSSSSFAVSLFSLL